MTKVGKAVAKEMLIAAVWVLSAVTLGLGIAWAVVRQVVAAVGG